MLPPRAARRSCRWRSRDRPISRATFSRGRKSRRLERIASSITAACARLKPENGACDDGADEPRAEARPLLVLRDALRPPAPNARSPPRAAAPGPPSATIGQSRRPVRQPAKMRTSSTWLATACGTSRRLSSVREGRNGATIQCSPSAMIPSGAMWTAPARSTVVTIVSRIIGIGSAALLGAKRVAGLRQAACGPPPGGRRRRPSRAARPAHSACRG